jgi:hypothetical protein
MVGDYRGGALFIVLRNDGKDGAAWSPLASSEGLTLSESGLATVEVQSFGRLMITWMQGLEHTEAAVEMLANMLLAGMESRGQVPDATFRASFRLACVEAVTIDDHRSGDGSLLVCMCNPNLPRYVAPHAFCSWAGHLDLASGPCTWPVVLHGL